MKAVVMSQFGDSSVLSLKDVPKPEIQDGEILVKIKAVGINPIDIAARSSGGPIKKIIEAALPVILGWDIAGTVEETNSESFTTGDRVFALSKFPQIAGGYAEFAAVSANEAVVIPDRLSFEEAAAVPLAALTAWQSLVDTADLKPDQRVLIHAAAGGVGHFAVQIAKHIGVYVIGSASPNNFEFLENLGVNEVVDYNVSPIGEQISNVDVVLHSLLPNLRETASWPCLKQNGLLVSLKGPVPEEEAARFKGRGAAIGVRPNADQLGTIASLLQNGTFNVTLDKVYPLKDVKAAHSQIETGHTRGKIVLSVA